MRAPLASWQSASFSHWLLRRLGGASGSAHSASTRLHRAARPALRGPASNWRGARASLLRWHGEAPARALTCRCLGTYAPRLAASAPLLRVCCACAELNCPTTRVRALLLALGAHPCAHCCLHKKTHWGLGRPAPTDLVDVAEDSDEAVINEAVVATLKETPASLELTYSGAQCVTWTTGGLHPPQALPLRTGAQLQRRP